MNNRRTNNWRLCIALVAGILVATGCASQRGKDPSLKQGARDVGTSLGKTTREIGQEAKKAGKAVGEAAKEGGKAFKEALNGK